MAQSFVRASVAALQDSAPPLAETGPTSAGREGDPEETSNRFFPYRLLHLAWPTEISVSLQENPRAAWWRDWVSVRSVRSSSVPNFPLNVVDWPPADVAAVDWVSLPDLPLLPREGGGLLVSAQSWLLYGPLRRALVGEQAWTASRMLADWSSWCVVEAASRQSVASDDMLSLQADTVESVEVE